jgi:tetratricopeptide (TPR) repeat protein
VQWARQAAGRYRDGQLYIDLRGFTATPPLRPGEALARFLRALGVPPGQIPSDPEEAAAAYRTRLAAAQMLIVLDNARQADQVRPLLPGGPGCTVLITSRDRLAGLAATDGAHLVALEPFTDGEAHDLLVRRLGHTRVADESTATALARMCGHLPLALSIAAARLAASQHTSIAELVDELRASHSPLDTLTVGDLATDIRQVISWSYRSLDAPTARMFRLLALHPGADVTVPAAASLGGVSTVRARQALRALTQRCLLHEHTPGRFALHDLLRAYGTEQVTASEPAIERDAAIGRLLGHYLHSVYLADSRLNPKRQRIALDRMPDGAQLVDHADSTQALAWFDAEHHNLLAAGDLAAAAGRDRDVWQLSWAMATFLLRRGHTNDWISSQRAALSATRRLADAPAEARILLGLSRAHATAGRYGEARQYADRALTAYRRLGDRVGQGRTYLSLNLILTRQGRDEEALGVAVRALELYDATGDRHAQAAAHNAIGWYHARHGQRDLASEHCTTAVRLFQDLGDPAGEAAAWDSLGHAHCRAEDYPGAVECYQRAVAGHRAAGAHRSHAGTLLHLSEAYDACGDHEAADRARQAALAVMAKAGRTRASADHRTVMPAPPP